jgi:hypothetical protein
VTAEVRRLLKRAFADGRIRPAVEEGVVQEDHLHSEVGAKLEADPAFLAAVAEIVEMRAAQRQGEFRRRFMHNLVDLLSVGSLGLWRLVLLTTGLWLGVVTAARGRGEIIQAAVLTGLFFAGLVLLRLQQPRFRRRQEEVERTQREVLDKIEARREGLLERTILPLARELVNRLRHLPFNDLLTPTDTSGLKDLYDPEYEVSVTATAELRQMLSGLTAGSIGIAGPRGVGKTTLIRAACEGRLDGEKSASGKAHPQGLRVSAPMRYGAQDFVRHLFAELCLRELSLPPGQEATRELNAGAARVFRSLTAFTAVLVTLLTALVGALVAHRSLALSLSFAVPLGLFTGIAGYVWAGTYLRDRRFPVDESPLQKEASEALSRLRYLETLSTEWTGEVSAKAASVGAKLGGKRGMSLAAQAWTLPEVIESYRRFVGRLTDRGSLVIGIDELDKMTSAEEARGFLNEMKSLFDQPDVFYLVSVSEDALSDFERRGQPIRDVLDSVFNDVLHVGYLKEEESNALLRRRAVGIPPPWPALFHCLAGGLPRESIRVARRAVAVAEELRPDLTTVTLALVAERAAAHEHAATVIARGQVAADGTQPVLTWLDELPPISVEEGNGDPRSSFEAAHSALQARMRAEHVLTALHGWSGNGARASGGDDLERLVMELTAGWHHSLSCLEFFAGLTAAKFDRARKVKPGLPSAIELLARGHQQLSASPALSWRTVESFRTETGLSPHSYPRPESRRPDLNRGPLHYE